MRRWLLNIVTALSLVLLLATVALWARSYWISDTVYDTTEKVEGEWYVTGSKTLFSNRGAFTFPDSGDGRRWTVSRTTLMTCSRAALVAVTRQGAGGAFRPKI